MTDKEILQAMQEMLAPIKTEISNIHAELADQKQYSRETRDMLESTTRETRELFESTNHETRNMLESTTRETRELIEQVAQYSRETRDMLESTTRETRELIKQVAEYSRETRDMLESTTRETRVLLEHTDHNVSLLAEKLLDENERKVSPAAFEAVAEDVSTLKTVVQHHSEQIRELQKAQ